MVLPSVDQAQRDQAAFALRNATTSWTLNLFLTLRIATIVRGTPALADSRSPLELDVAIPEFTGTMLADGRSLSAEALTGHATVFVFLSSRCGDCRRKIPEIVRLLPAMRRAGVMLLAVAMDSETRTRKFLGHTPLFEHIVLLDKEDRLRLNPFSATPLYIFVDDQRHAKASSHIGDENWQAFVRQMDGLATEGGPAHG
jgi:peroxiredoxin